MTSNSAPGYAAAEVLLDAVIAFDSDDLEVSVDAVNLALRRLADVKARIRFTSTTTPAATSPSRSTCRTSSAEPSLPSVDS